jgi:hypothetical protein
MEGSTWGTILCVAAIFRQMSDLIGLFVEAGKNGKGEVCGRVDGCGLLRFGRVRRAGCNLS